VGVRVAVGVGRLGLVEELVLVAQQDVVLAVRRRVLHGRVGRVERAAIVRLIQQRVQLGPRLVLLVAQAAWR
jgi:hypothetical protein